MQRGGYLRVVVGQGPPYEGVGGRSESDWGINQGDCSAKGAADRGECGGRVSPIGGCVRV